MNLAKKVFFILHKTNILNKHQILSWAIAYYFMSQPITGHCFMFYQSKHSIQIICTKHNAFKLGSLPTTVRFFVVYNILKVYVLSAKYNVPTYYTSKMKNKNV